MVQRRDPKTMSKAERMLGVGDTTGMMPLKKAMSDTSRKSSRSKGFTSAFSELKGVFSGNSSRNSSRGRKTPNSPAFQTANDSDSMNSAITSTKSPTFDPTGSNSTLPSIYEPTSPHYNSRRESSGTSSPNEQVDLRHDYHAALSPLRHKIPSDYDMPAISEVYGQSDEYTHVLPPLEKAPLSPDPPSTPSNRTSFLPANMLRSPSSTSVASESTAKGKWLGWRYSKSMGKEVVYDYPSSATANPMINSELLAGTQHTAAVEDWLARADLRRRPSQASAVTKSTVPHSINLAFSPSSSTMSVRTLTTQKDAILTPTQPPISFSHQHSRVRENVGSPIKAALKFNTKGRITGKNLMLDSVLFFSSSEDESSDDELGRKNMPAKRVGIFRGEVCSLDQQSDSPTLPTTIYTPDMRIVKPQSISQARPKVVNVSNGSLTLPTKKPVLGNLRSAPSAVRNSTHRPPFAAVQWQDSDETELGNICIDAAERVYPIKEENKLTVLTTSKRPISSSSSMMSPTTNKPGLSKREELMLASLRDGMESEKALSDSDTLSVTSNPIISVSPPRRKRKPKASESAEEMSTLEEDRVISFPTPPANLASHGRSSSTISLTLSNSVHPDAPTHVQHSDDSDAISLPSILMSPSIGSRLSSVSDLTQTPTQTRAQSDAPAGMPAFSYELYGSVPTINHSASMSHHGHKQQKHSIASSTGTTHIYSTGLERNGSADEDDVADDDLAEYVLASCM